ncbi:MAG: RagB/SusD family nutrient uptake outer membrane protein [Cyclobacteriaceae bacterium]
MRINKYHTFYIGLAFLFVLSCDGILDEDPQDQIFVSNFFQSENDAIGAVNSIYAALNSTSTAPTFGGVYHSTYWVIQGLASDEMNNRQAGAPQNDQLETFTFNSANANLFDVWSTTYKAINNANFAIGGITNSPIDETLRTRLIGEASFLRGILYFDLVRMFGEIPLVLEDNDELRPPKNSIDEVYTQIIADLNLAVTSLPASYSAGDGLGRATTGAASGALAKVHLTRGEWQQSIDNALNVINSGNYNLWPDFADAFRIANENGQETVFGIGFGDGGGAITFWEVGQFNVRLLPRELSLAVPGINAQGWQVATQDLFDAYDANDRRRSVTLMTDVAGDALDDPFIRKYWDEIGEPQGGNTDADFIYLRYSDVLLMYAEALNELNNGPNGDAYDAINQVRRRARFDGTQDQNVLPDLSGLTYQEFQDAILLERRKELVAEGHRWFDLVRTGRLQELVPLAKSGVVPAATHNLFPIPQREVDLNPNLLPQNPGY